MCPFKEREKGLELDVFEGRNVSRSSQVREGSPERPTGAVHRKDAGRSPLVGQYRNSEHDDHHDGERGLQDEAQQPTPQRGETGGQRSAG